MPLQVGIDALTLIPGRIGGGETFLLGVLGALARRDDVRVSVFASAGNVERLRECVPALDYRVVMRRNEQVPRRVLFEQFRLPRIIRRSGVPVMFFPNNQMSLACPVPAVLFVHDLVIDYYLRHFPRQTTLRDRVVRRLVHRSIRRADRLACPTEAVRDEIAAQVGVPPSRIAVTFEAARRFPPPARPRSRSFEPGRFMFLLPCSTALHKNIPVVLKALGILKRSDPELYKATTLVLTGNPHRAELVVRDDIAREDVTDRVVLAGYLPEDELAWLYERAAALIFPSVYEGFGLPVLEMMTVGRPVIISDIPVFHEISGGHALFFPPTDAEALCRWMVDVMQRPESVSSLVRSAKEYADSVTWDRTAEVLCGEFRKCVESA